MNKTQLTLPDSRPFDLKFLLVSNSGGGKTHLCGTYTDGPIHFYMFDHGGEKTLYKLLKDRPESSPITVDSINTRKQSYSDFWRTLQKDEKSGMFDQFAEQHGMVVFDSLSAINDMIISEVAKKNGRDLSSSDKPLRIQDWGQAISWMKTLIGVINSLPCAAIATAHLYSESDSDGAISQRYPAVSGQYRSMIGNDFDEVYYLTERMKKRFLYMTKFDGFQAKSRSFSMKNLENPTLDLIADKYRKGEIEW